MSSPLEGDLTIPVDLIPTLVRAIEAMKLSDHVGPADLQLRMLVQDEMYARGSRE